MYEFLYNISSFVYGFCLSTFNVRPFLLRKLTANHDYNHDSLLFYLLHKPNIQQHQKMWKPDKFANLQSINFPNECFESIFPQNSTNSQITSLSHTHVSNFYWFIWLNAKKLKTTVLVTFFIFFAFQWNLIERQSFEIIVKLNRQRIWNETGKAWMINLALKVFISLYNGKYVCLVV